MVGSYLNHFSYWRGDMVIGKVGIKCGKSGNESGLVGVRLLEIIRPSFQIGQSHFPFSETAAAAAIDSVTVASFCRLSRTTVSAKSLVSSSVFPSGTSTIYDSSTTVHKPPPLSRSDSPNSVTDAVLAADDGESGDPLFFVEYVEPLGAGARRKAGDDSNLAKAADANLAAFHNGAAADKVFVYLRAVESANHRPDGRCRSPDPLRDQGGALTGA
ncbi:hypothetical protein IEQ34_013977 [Dendrobium chrysotoxum]|uniref:Uncharacterized protein n=1 Tax=Dendrobium chrysotoxum TaxID=161865 RepID=A0AAV7GIN8_DENCH|nr:hypothetical protein IEQ34_013977 [Dendrobium chrysotoxum]